MGQKSSIVIHQRIIIASILSTILAIVIVGSTLKVVLEKTTFENWKKRLEFVSLEFAPQCDFEILEGQKSIEFLSKLPAFSDLPYADKMIVPIKGVSNDEEIEKRKISQSLLDKKKRYFR